METSNFIYKVIFILTLSTIFPMVGYYLDYRSKKKRFKRRSDIVGNQSNTDSK
ncbi:hypothetical protein KMW28_14585 [Flammeovirga yaeyamensis]|uniref:Uncharacterized protein n=1 Tax=Flammeovirga yaeyamensis TaxID=367791 RepID=A0AAX1N049_9BACT|nr:MULTISPECIES: hypothetical protein [Flammeovirga]ANQ47717.1 hypothetical protein MY04_0335 [Flammeovirga sp. MY04]MBB3700181.1 hypothetical protein [Flammeovirga yaeyamensis]NMF37189.1 hypothetical protein [Flammeovirga yaeyamensis]QWG00879.1 hypothetical protein KMW28_14585 [Flammeovirga yaeyamensis]